jgi:hypothetical protein
MCCAEISLLTECFILMYPLLTDYFVLKYIPRVLTECVVL